MGTLTANMLRTLPSMRNRSRRWEDLSDSKHDLTFNGDVEIITDVLPNSNFKGSVKLATATSDSIQIPDHADFAFGSEDFTIDGWVRWTNSGGYDFIITQWEKNTNSTQAFEFGKWDDNGLYFEAENGSNGDIIFLQSVASLISPDTWYHVAAVRNGTNAWLFLNGVIVATDSSVSGSIVNSSSDVLIGGYWDTGGSSIIPSLRGYISELRISDTARWTSDFSGSLPTTPHENDANTVLLLQITF